MNINVNEKTFGICVTHCYKCRIFKKSHPEVKVIELRNSIEGLGDIISIIAYWFHIPHCANCERRRNILNDLFPLKWLIPASFRHPKDNKLIRILLKKYKTSKFPVIFNWDEDSKTYSLLQF
jgi:hypothetical protein